MDRAILPSSTHKDQAQTSCSPRIRTGTRERGYRTVLLSWSGYPSVIYRRITSPDQRSLLSSMSDVRKRRRVGRRSELYSGREK